MDLHIDLHLLVQTLLYLAVALAGLVASVSIGVTYIKLSNQCILYATIDWTHSVKYSPVVFSSPSVCNACTWILVLLSILYPLGMGIYYGYATYKSRTDKTIASKMWVMPFMLGTTLVTTLVLIVSCIISVGFALLCKSIMTGKDKGHKIDSCADIVVKIYDSNSIVRGGTIFNSMTVAQWAAWVAFLVWVVQLAFTILHLVRNGRMRSRNAPDTT